MTPQIVTKTQNTWPTEDDDQMTAQPSNSLVDQIWQKTARDWLTTRWVFLLGGPDKARHLAVQKI